MNTFQDCLTPETTSWLKDNNLNYKVIDFAQSPGKLILLFNDKLYLKVYDRLGHGFAGAGSANVRPGRRDCIALSS